MFLLSIKGAIFFSRSYSVTKERRFKIASLLSLPWADSGNFGAIPNIMNFAPGNSGAESGLLRSNFIPCIRSSLHS